MLYIGNVIRPPSEADSALLQVAVGCPHNQCTFCGAYKDVKHHLRSSESLFKQLHWTAHHRPHCTRVFLADGDALAISQKRLKEIFEQIRHILPNARRISLYGSSRSIRTKGVHRLRQLKERGLDRIYMGVESGLHTILAKIRKGDDVAGMEHAATIVLNAGLFLSVTVLLGLGGKELSREHAMATAALLNSMKPNQIAVLTLMVLENTELGAEIRRGCFQTLSSEEILHELYVLISQLTTRSQFHANHASSYLPLAGRLPKDREKLLHQIVRGIEGDTPLVPEYWRTL